ncbi:DUF3300 domain-containing protein [Silvimonas iriomotensis]|uniref:Membrane protein n=1 Tax=Silvimonas iriomotensis TaxID=449662 RepID=A0ABQ2PCT0_9NEIS|nr:DUF3300 domain-containing protein [Silvimonas iriomotensis]GGP22950.1 membrane protein [Silvimonas iriomotensis]
MLVSVAGHAADDQPLSNAQLDQLVAPIALYPDSLLSQLLMATTYPDEFAKAYEWSKAHPDAKGDAAVKQVESQNWDPSVASMVAFPEVLITLGGQPKWVKDMGDAFLGQTSGVMDAVQRLRAQAQKAGNLKSNEQVTVTSQPASTSSSQQVIVVEPAKPDVVYVPAYNPTVVYGAWAYPTYPPYYYPPPPGYWFSTAVMTGIAWGVGIAVGNALWGGCNWGSSNVNINVNKYNNINTNRKIEGGGDRSSWKHDPGHRTSDYRGGSAERNRRQQDFNTNQREQFRGRDNAGTRDVGNRDNGGRNNGNREVANRDNARENSRRQAAQTMENRGIGSPDHRGGGSAGQMDRNRGGGQGGGFDNSNRARGDTGARQQPSRDNALTGVNDRQSGRDSARGRESMSSQRSQGTSRAASSNRSGGGAARSTHQRPARSGGRGR